MFIAQICFTIIACLLGSYVVGALLLRWLLPQASPLLYIAGGFITFQAFFWFIAIGFVYLKGSWHVLFWLAVVMLLALLFLALTKKELYQQFVMQLKTTTTLQKTMIVMVILIGVAHGVLQIGFWNIDNSMSDNSFYVTIANYVVDNVQLYAVNGADGMPQSTIVADYLVGTYEMSVGFLASAFHLHPAVFMRIIMPIIMSVSTVLTIFVLLRQLLKKDIFALCGLLLFLFVIYCSTNYKSNINDFMLEEWFLYYYYVGKAIVRFLVIPFLISILVSTYQRLQATITTKALLKLIVLYNIIGVSCYALSPAAALYYLLLMFVFFLLLLFKKQIATLPTILLGIGSALAGLLGSIITILTKIIYAVPMSTAENSDSTGLLRFLGIGSEYYNFELFKTFFF